MNAYAPGAVAFNASSWSMLDLKYFSRWFMLQEHMLLEQLILEQLLQEYNFGPKSHRSGVCGVAIGISQICICMQKRRYTSRSMLLATKRARESNFPVQKITFSGEFHSHPQYRSWLRATFTKRHPKSRTKQATTKIYVTNVCITEQLWWGLHVPHSAKRRNKS